MIPSRVTELSTTYIRCVSMVKARERSRSAARLWDRRKDPAMRQASLLDLPERVERGYRFTDRGGVCP